MLRIPYITEAIRCDCLIASELKTRCSLLLFLFCIVICTLLPSGAAQSYAAADDDDQSYYGDNQCILRHISIPLFFTHGER